MIKVLHKIDYHKKASIFLLVIVFLLSILLLSRKTDLSNVEKLENEIKLEYSKVKSEIKSVETIVSQIVGIHTNLIIKLSEQHKYSHANRTPANTTHLTLFEIPEDAIFASYKVSIANGIPFVNVFGVSLYPNCIFRGVRVLSVDSERIVFANGQVIINSGVRDVPQD